MALQGCGKKTKDSHIFLIIICPPVSPGKSIFSERRFLFPDGFDLMDCERFHQGGAVVALDSVQQIAAWRRVKKETVRTPAV